MRILITGGSGFIGQELLLHLKTKHTICSLDLQTKSSRINGVEYMQGDYANRTILDSVLPDTDLVIHLAHSSTPSDSANDPVFELQSNVLSTVRLMESMEWHRVPRIIYFSSGGAVYGQKERACSEEDALDPLSNYGISKASTEFFVRQFARNNRLSATIIRPSNVYGPRIDKFGKHGVISTILHCLQTNTEFKVWGTTEISKDYLLVHDLVKVIDHIIDHPYDGTLNVGSGKYVSISHLIQLCEQITGKALHIQITQSLKGDVNSFCLNIQRLKCLMPNLEITPIHQGIEQMWQTYSLTSS